MSFEVNGKQVVLKGDPSLCRSLMSLKTIMKDILSEKEGLLLELCSLDVENDVLQGVPKQIQSLLGEFEGVF